MSEQEYAFKGVWIPAEIFLAEDLTATEILMLAEIHALDGDNGCFASNTHFANRFKTTQKQASRVINGLIAKGYLIARMDRKGKQIIKRTLRVVGIPKIGIPLSPNCGDPIPNYADTPIPKNAEEKEQVLNNKLDIYKAQAPKRFIAPTVEEVRDYCQERSNQVNAQRFIDYYTSNGWKVGRNKMKCWKSAVRNWERNASANQTKQQQRDELNHALTDYETAKYNW